MVEAALTLLLLCFIASVAAHCFCIRKINIMRNELNGVIQRFTEAGIAISDAMSTDVKRPEEWRDWGAMSDEDIAYALPNRPIPPRSHDGWKDLEN